MLEAFYHLSSEPFRLSPDPKFSFSHRTYRKAMTYMRVALHRAEGFIIITGQPGMGKTTLINDLLKELKTDKVTVAKLVSTQLKADDLLHLMAYSFGLDPEGRGKAAVLNGVEQFLKQQRMQGKRSLLIVDEAQDVTEAALEELRLLTNMQVDSHQLLQIFLIGQQELRDIVSAPSMEQLHQRVIAATHLEPLDRADTKTYIQHRLQKVGWSGDPAISEEAYAMIYRFSNGIPRQINQVCSRLLLHGALEEKHKLGLQDLKTVIEELREELLLPIGVQEIADTIEWPEEHIQETYEAPPAVAPPSPEPRQAPRAATGTTATAPDPSNRKSVIRTLPKTGEESPRRQPPSPGPRRMPQAVAGKTATAPDLSNRESVIRTLPDTHEQQSRGQPSPPKPHQAPRAKTDKTATTPGMADKKSVIRTLPKKAANIPVNRPGVPRKEPVPLPEQVPETAGEATPSVLADAVPLPDTDEDSPTRGHKRRHWKLPVIIALLAGLSVTLFYKIGPGTGNDLVAWLNAGLQKAGSSFTLPLPDHTTPSDPLSNTGTPLPGASPGHDSQGARQDPGQQGLVAELLDIEKVLTENGLLVKRLDDNSTLRVDLSSGGLFVFVTERIQESAGPTLQILADVLNKHNHLVVQVVGHTDSTGPAGYNLNLSQLRATAVADYLVKLGLSSSRIQAEGRGDRDTREEQSPNYSKRRIEIYIRPAQASQNKADHMVLQNHDGDLHMQ